MSPAPDRGHTCAILSQLWHTPWPPLLDRNGDLLVSGATAGPLVFGGVRLNANATDNFAFVAKIDMSTGSVAWLHRFWAGGAERTYADKFAALPDGRMAVLVVPLGSPLMLDDTVLAANLPLRADSIPLMHLVVFKP